MFKTIWKPKQQSYSWYPSSFGTNDIYKPYEGYDLHVPPPSDVIYLISWIFDNTFAPSQSCWSTTIPHVSALNVYTRGLISELTRMAIGIVHCFKITETTFRVIGISNEKEGIWKGKIHVKLSDSVVIGWRDANGSCRYYRFIRIWCSIPYFMIKWPKQNFWWLKASCMVIMTSRSAD